ncbi:hypothetical protein KR222_000069, partial [Zaprionus bogoriensis]
MRAQNILDLNDDCLGHILGQLPVSDYNQFGQVCTRFRDVFVARAGKRYRQFTLDPSCKRRELVEFCICRESVQSLTIDLDHFNEARIFRSHGCETPAACFSVLCSALGGMISLRHLVVKQQVRLVLPAEKPYEQIIAAVRNLEELSVLEIHARDGESLWKYRSSEKNPNKHVVLLLEASVENLWMVNRVQELHLRVHKIPSSHLAKFCRANRNLRLLHLGYDCVQGNLKDIVPHCDNLETLKFGMMAEAAAYQPLSKLPKLKKLIHFGIRRQGSFLPLLTALAARAQLQWLEIDGGTLSAEEVQQIVRLSELRQLKCFCSTAESVELLAQLTQLQQLCLWMSSRVDISDALLRVLSRCRQLQVLRVASGFLGSSFINDVCRL